MIKSKRTGRFSIALTILFVGLALGSSWWFGLYRNIHVFNREVNQEDRHAEVVGAKPLPKDPIAIVIKNKKDGCCKIDRAEIDGNDLYVYYHNSCATRVTAFVYWKEKAPDGTVILSDSHYLGDNIDANETREYRYSYFKSDPRISSLEIGIE